MPALYLIGSLRNSTVPALANKIQKLGIEAFASWHAAGPMADDEWQRYETERGLSYGQALKDYAARHVFAFDKFHLDRCDGAVLIMPAGKSGHLEFGYMMGRGKVGWVLFDEVPSRWDCMYQFATDVAFDEASLLTMIGEQFAS